MVFCSEFLTAVCQQSSRSVTASLHTLSLLETCST